MKSCFQAFIFLSLFLAGWCYSIFENNPIKSLQEPFLHFLSNEELIRASSTDNNFNVDNFTSNNDMSNNNAGADDMYFAPIMSLFYYGSWKSVVTPEAGQFGYFNKTSGFAEFTAYKNAVLGIDDNITFGFYDGEYIDQKFVKINFVYNNDTDFNPANSTFKNDSIVFSVSFLEGLKFINKTFCEGSYQLSFIDISKKAPYKKSSNNYQRVYAEFSLNSQNCSISVSSTVYVNDVDSKSKAMYYAFMMLLICITHFYATVKVSNKILAHEVEGTRISLITLAFLVGWDVCLCIFHLYDSLVMDIFFTSFVIPAFAYFVLTTLFETRLTLLVWKTKNFHLFETLDDVRRGLFKFYIQFYVALIIGAIFCFYFITQAWFLYLTSLYFVPQIVHNAMRGQRCKFDPTYIFLFGVTRIILPLYIKACPENIFRLTPQDDFAYNYLGIILFQVIVLLLQSVFGARFFIPPCFLPTKYNYYVKNPPKFTSEEEECCPICMDLLNEISSHTRTSLLEERLLKADRLMKTPCNHYFHERCLKGWMDLKLDCPFCRAVLPPID